MRLRRRLRQTELAVAANTGQSAISRIEKDDYDGWTYKTLLAIATVLKARLRIRLEPLEDVIEEYRRSEAESESTSAFDILESAVANTSEETVIVSGGRTGADVAEIETTNYPMWMN